MLKTREYMARGQPFVIGYEDPDLNGMPTSQRFCEALPNDSSAIGFGDILEFVQRFNTVPGPVSVSSYMRQYASEHMD